MCKFTVFTGSNGVICLNKNKQIFQEEKFASSDEDAGFSGEMVSLNKRLSSSVTVNGSEPGQKWLDCPEGALVLQATASTSAGEGLRGKQIYYPAADPASQSLHTVSYL